MSNNSGTQDSKDQAQNLRMMVQGNKGNEPEGESADEQVHHDEELRPASDRADHDVGITVDETEDQAVQLPEQHEEKAEDMMNQDANVLETGAAVEREEAELNTARSGDQTGVFESSSEPDATGRELNDDLIDEDYLNQVIEELCVSKAEEFAMLGYEGVTGKDIWDFVSERYEQKGFPPLHRLINDILSLKPTHYMNWLTLSAYKGKLFHE